LIRLEICSHGHVGRVASNIRLRKGATARHVEAATKVPAQPVKFGIEYLELIIEN